MTSLVEYVGAFVVSMDDGSTRKLFDSAPFLKSAVSLATETQARKALKELRGQVEVNRVAKKALNFQHSVYVYSPGGDVFFAFAAAKDSPEAKLFALYSDLRSDLEQVCRIDRIQDLSLVDGHFQRQLEPKLEARIDQYRSVIKGEKIKIAFGKADEAKALMKENVIQMSENVGMTKEKLLPTSQEL